MRYDLVVADLARQKSKELSDKAVEGLVDAVARGQSPHAIAKRKYPKDRIKRQRLRRRIQKALANDPRFAIALGERSKAALLAGLPLASEGLAKRATRRTDATKLLFETTGFHNPRVQHEHSGQITVKLDMPRPVFAQDADGVIDADVVED